MSLSNPPQAAVWPPMARNALTRSPTRSGCRTAKVKVAGHPESLAEDLARVRAELDRPSNIG
ncbi:MAG: hypothetical protein ACRDQ4_12280 [Pseudonocardiaceae bacterium]